MVGDVREKLRTCADQSFDLIIADPPYGETSLEWDKWPEGWPGLMLRVLKATGSMWVFGSTRMFMKHAADFSNWQFAQDIVWEKHNGSNAFADRFRRVHELAAQFYPKSTPWADVYKKPLYTNDATARTVRRKQRPPQWGDIGESHFISEDGGPRLRRSVIYEPSMHGKAIHPTQKPVEIVRLLVEYSCPKGGAVLDPFLGSGTTALAAKVEGCDCVGIEGNADYAKLAGSRIDADFSLFSNVQVAA